MFLLGHHLYLVIIIYYSLPRFFLLKKSAVVRFSILSVCKTNTNHRVLCGCCYYFWVDLFSGKMLFVVMYLYRDGLESDDWSLPFQNLSIGGTL